MNCKDFIKEQLKGRLSRESLTHPEHCEECKAVLLEIDKQIEEIGNDRITETNPFFYTRVKQRLENSQTKVSPVFSKRVIALVGNVSSLVIIGMFLGLLFFKQFDFEKQNQITKEVGREQMIESLMNDHFLISESKSISVFESVSDLPEQF